MNEVTSPVLDARATGAYARAEALVPPGPVRAVDPLKPRFSVVDGGKAATADGPAARQGEAATPSTADGRAAEAGRAARGPGLLGALTNFLARTIGQVAEGQGVLRSTLLSGLRAYGRAAAAPASPERPGVEILPPNLPRLSSGRVVDLSI